MKYLPEWVKTDIMIIRIRFIIVQISACGAQNAQI